jgi:protein-tyrosine-phosphatase
MRDRGYDLTQHRSLSEIPKTEYAAIVTMGCGDACPAAEAKRREEWNIPDPKVMSPEEFRKVRDLIEKKVKALIEEELSGA